MSARQPAHEGGEPQADWLGRFEPSRPLASGRFTRNFLCRETTTGARVIVREVRPIAWWRPEERSLAMAALAREAEILTALAAGPAAGVFPAVAGVGTGAAPAWIAIESVEGASLRDVFRPGSGGRIPDETGWTLTRTLEALLSLRHGLLALAQLRTAHGCLRPETLIAVPAGGDDAGSAPPRLRCAELGWAALPPETRRVPDPGALPYASPALLDRLDPPGPGADAWSLAAILFELLAGRPVRAVPRSGSLDHEWRFALRRAAAADPPDLLPARLPEEIAGFLKRMLAGRAAGRPDAGGEPDTVDFFSGLEQCLAIARRNASWRAARLPNPRIQAAPPAPALLARHDELWKTWRAATRRHLEAFHDLLDLAPGPPWSDWKAEIERAGAVCLGRQAADDPARADADSLPPALREVENRIARLGRIAAEAVAALEPGLRQAADRIARGPGVAGELEGRVQSFAAGVDRLRNEAATPDLLVLAARLRGAAPQLEEDLREVQRAQAEAQREIEQRGRAARARADAAAAIEHARRAAAALADAGERAAERAILAGAADQESAGTFCRALERLERAAGAAAGRLGVLGTEAPPDADLAAGLGDLERQAAEARRAWWPAERLPLSRREWEAYEKRVLTLTRKGAGGIKKARALLEADPPSGWEQAARALIPTPAPEAEPASGLAERSQAEPGPSPAPPAMPIAEALPAEILLPGQETVPAPRRAPAVRPSSGRLRAAVLGGIAAAAVLGVVAWVVLRPAPSATTAGSQPGKPPQVVTEVPLARAWLSGPALPSLTARVEWDGGRADPVALPGTVTFPDRRSVRLFVSWNGGSSRDEEIGMATAASLQAGVNGLLRDVAPTAIEERLDREVAGMAAGLLEGRR